MRNKFPGNNIFTSGIWVKARWLGVQGITLWPFILIKKIDLLQKRPFVRHERIHLQQQIELLIIPFYVLYILFYLLGRLQGRTHDAAYRNIPFEQEAYQFESENGYLRSRPIWNWRRFSVQNEQGN